MYYRAANTVIVLRKFTFNLLKPFCFFIYWGAAVEFPLCCTRSPQQLGLCCRGWACLVAVVVPWDLLFSKATSTETSTTLCSSYHLRKPLIWKVHLPALTSSSKQGFVLWKALSQQNYVTRGICRIKDGPAWAWQSAAILSETLGSLQF